MCIETIQFTISKELQYDVFSLSRSVCNTISMLSSIIPVKSWYEKSSSYASAIENELQMNLLEIKSIIIKSWCSQKELGSDFCFWSGNQFGCDCFEIGFRLGVSFNCDYLENNIYIVFPKSFDMDEQSQGLNYIKNVISSIWKVKNFNLFYW